MMKGIWRGTRAAGAGDVDMAAQIPRSGAENQVRSCRRWVPLVLLLLTTAARADPEGVRGLDPGARLDQERGERLAWRGAIEDRRDAAVGDRRLDRDRKIDRRCEGRDRLTEGDLLQPRRDRLAVE